MKARRTRTRVPAADDQHHRKGEMKHVGAMRRVQLVALGIPLSAAVACGGLSSAPSSGASASAAVAATTSASEMAPVGAKGGLVVEPSHGLSIAFPAGWVVLTPTELKDNSALTALKTGLGTHASAVDELAAAMNRHPEYWFAAARMSDGNNATGQLRATDPGGWASAQQATLQQAYGSVASTPLPKGGTAFTFESTGRATKLFGFPRTGGVVILTFASSTAQPGSGWDDIVATYRDDGK